ncbi:MAG: hypothetical protein A2010_19175 [Nitrospirae bacterium GWD2_57_9]|nr:MAG: hypothetical protein A2010_19175 [Nitrospirae bacterium GWD2_57_9]
MSSKKKLKSETRNSKPDGFTLLEVLLAMAIVSLIMTVIYVSFTTTSNSVQQAESIRAETDLARILLTRLSSDIANAYVKGTNGIFESKKEELTEESPRGGEKVRHDSITMTTLTNYRPRQNSTETELWEVSYFLKEKPDSKGYSLFRREKRELDSESAGLDNEVEYEITDRVESIRFRFMDRSGLWADNGWTTRQVLPRAVEIVVVMNTGKVYTTSVDLGNS